MALLLQFHDIDKNHYKYNTHTNRTWIFVASYSVISPISVSYFLHGMEIFSLVIIWSVSEESEVRRLICRDSEGVFKFPTDFT